jgi:hypothetical protein
MKSPFFKKEDGGKSFYGKPNFDEEQFDKVVFSSTAKIWKGEQKPIDLWTCHKGEQVTTQIQLSEEKNDFVIVGTHVLIEYDYMVGAFFLSAIRRVKSLQSKTYLK